MREQGYARAIQGQLLTEVGRYADAITVCASAFTDLQTVGDQYGATLAQWAAALATGRLGDRVAGTTWLSKIERQLGEIGEQYLRAIVLNCLAGNMRINGEIVSATAAAEASLALRRALDDQRGIACCLWEQGSIVLCAGDHQTAVLLFQECLEIANRLKDHHLWTQGLEGLGWSAFQRKEWESARQFFKQSLAITRQAGRPMWTAFELYSLGAVAVEEGNPELAWDYFGEGLELAYRIGDVAAVTDVLAGIAELFLQNGKLPQAVQLCTFVAKHRSSRRFIRREAEFLAQLQATLSPEVYQSSVMLGKAMTLEEAVNFAQETAAIEHLPVIPANL
jgi:tetratricopeptide (TPR) repeat protein